MSDITNRGEGAPVAPAHSEIDSFLAELKGRTTATTGKRGRLVFGLDATMSRQGTWDTACMLQADMFHQIAAAGGLDMQLVYYRGISECRASRWFSQPEQLAKTMSQIVCNAGYTQIEKVLIHAQRETKLLQVSALVFVGDAMEENPDALAGEANKLGRPSALSLRPPTAPIAASMRDQPSSSANCLRPSPYSPSVASPHWKRVRTRPPSSFSDR
jgi:hypothetical protein